MKNRQAEAMDLLNRFIDIIVVMERRCPSLKRIPSAKFRRIPADLISQLQSLADKADDLNAACIKDATGETNA